MDRVICLKNIENSLIKSDSFSPKVTHILKVHANYAQTRFGSSFPFHFTDFLLQYDVLETRINLVLSARAMSIINLLKL